MLLESLTKLVHQKGIQGVTNDEFDSLFSSHEVFNQYLQKHGFVATESIVGTLSRELPSVYVMTRAYVHNRK